MATAVEKPGRGVDVAERAPADMEVDAAPSGHDAGEGEDLYTRLKLGQRQLEFYEIQARPLPCVQAPRDASRLLPAARGSSQGSLLDRSLGQA